MCDGVWVVVREEDWLGLLDCDAVVEALGDPDADADAEPDALALALAEADGLGQASGWRAQGSS